MTTKNSRSSLITLKNVSKIYDTGDVKVHAVKDINLIINTNDYIAILGPSGSGKSTMMNLLGILDVPTKGTIHIENNNIATLSQTALAELRGKHIGFVFQQFNLIPTLTAAQNVELPMLFAGMPKKERLKRAQALLTTVGLSHRFHHLPSKLSGGEQQRVAIARSLANDPQIILADEPTGNLDSANGKNIMELLNTLHKKGKTIILVTHDTTLVKHAERVVELKDGQIIRDESTKR